MRRPAPPYAPIGTFVPTRQYRRGTGWTERAPGVPNAKPQSVDRCRGEPRRTGTVPPLVDLHGVGGQPRAHRRHGRHLWCRPRPAVPRPPRGARRGAWARPGGPAPHSGRGSEHRSHVDRPAPDPGGPNAAAGQAAPRPPAGLRGVLGLCVRRRQPGDPGGGHLVGRGHRPRRRRLVAHQPGRALLQQPAPLERRAVHGVPGHPPVGQVLDGGLAGQAHRHLGHRCRRLRRVDRRVLHRLPVPAELRLPVDLDQREGRHQLDWSRRVLQPLELRPDVALACRADPDRPGGDHRGARPARAGPRGRAPAADPLGARRSARRAARAADAAEWRGPDPPLRHRQGGHGRRCGRARPRRAAGRAAVVARCPTGDGRHVGEGGAGRLHRHRRQRASPARARPPPTVRPTTTGPTTCSGSCSRGRPCSGSASRSTPPRAFVLSPLSKLASTDPALAGALARYQSAGPSQRHAWANAYLDRGRQGQLRRRSARSCPVRTTARCRS